MMVKTVVFAPIPTAKHSTAASAKSGDFRIARQLYEDLSRSPPSDLQRNDSHFEYLGVRLAIGHPKSRNDRQGARIESR
jgi:hypothetical protein